MIAASYLRNVYFSKRQGHMTLAQSKITETVFFDSWPAFVADFLTNVTYPTPASHKFESYGWTPTIFAEGLNKDGDWGHWRLGANGGDELTLFIADMDNQFAEREMIPIDVLEAFLRSLGLPFVLYTSFSHKAERHKVRIVTPVSRLLTPDEAFAVFTWFNNALDYQLDGSIYDQGDYLYGPPHDADVRVELSGQPLDVDHYLTLADQLPEEAKTFVKRGGANHGVNATPEQVAQSLKMASIQEASREDVSISNPAVFPAAWLELLNDLYMGGSKSRTLRALCAKAWVRSGGSLTKGDLWTLYREMDATLGGYCLRTYGFQACDRDIRSAMEAVGSPISEPRQSAAEQHNARLEKEMARLARRA